MDAAVMGGSMTTLLRTIVNPAFILDGDGRLLDVNQAARPLFEPGALFLVAEGQVEPVDRALGSLWQMLKWRASRGLDATASLKAGEAPIKVTLLSLSAQETLALLPPVESGQSDLTLLMHFSKRHRLTAAETDVMVRLAAGSSACDIARVRCTSEATVRSQIRSLLIKTQTRSIRLLIALALKLK